MSLTRRQFLTAISGIAGGVGWAWWRTRAVCMSWRAGRRRAARPAPPSKFLNPTLRAESQDFEGDRRRPFHSAFRNPQSEIGRAFWGDILLLLGELLSGHFLLGTGVIIAGGALVTRHSA
jgi:hypothetical protein